MSSVKDCEHIRKALIGTKEDPEDRKWTILGQSFGGFCAITYLSFHSEGLKEVFLTGGLAPILNHPDDVYGALISRNYLNATVDNLTSVFAQRMSSSGIKFTMESILEISREYVSHR